VNDAAAKPAIFSRDRREVAMGSTISILVGRGPRSKSSGPVPHERRVGKGETYGVATIDATRPLRNRHGLAVARDRLENQLSDLVFPPKTDAANER
jgi:hypothetical protein